MILIWQKRLDALLPSNKNKVIPIHLALNSGGMSRNGLEVDNKSGLEKAKQISQLALT